MTSNSDPTTLSTASDFQALARKLQEARATRTAVRQFSKAHPLMTLAQSYEVQRAWVELKLDSGRRVQGHKIGMTSLTIQQTFQAQEPTHAPLMDDMYFQDGSDIPMQRLMAPRVEAELAFVLGKPLQGPNVTMFDALEAIAFVTPAIEIIDSRMQAVDPVTKGARNVIDHVADFAGCAGIVLGGRPMRADQLDLCRVGAVVLKNSAIEETGLSAAVMRHPVNAVVWLAKHLAAQGQQLHAGDLILAGSFTRPIVAALGDSFHADYGPLGNISFRFTDTR
jgi:2-oxo-hept-3-ene-1,7-dioate hydratase